MHVYVCMEKEKERKRENILCSRCISGLYLYNDIMGISIIIQRVFIFKTNSNHAALYAQSSRDQSVCFVL